MRIKIEGLITAERLAEALLAAQKEHGEHLLGFYGANLYLTAYNHDGQDFEMVSRDDPKTPLMITLEAGVQDLLRPSKSKAAKAQEAETSKEEKGKERQRKVNLNQQYAALALLRKELQDKKEAAVAKQKENEAVFARLVQSDAASLVEDLNRALVAIWKDEQRYPITGRNAGQLRPLPVFSVVNGAVYLAPSPSTALRKIKTPLSRIDAFKDDLVPLFAYEAWAKLAVPAFEKIIAERAALVAQGKAA